MDNLRKAFYGYFLKHESFGIFKKIKKYLKFQ